MKRSKRFRLLWAALLLLPVISEARVDKLYQQHCAACHGGKGEGGLGGSLVDGVYQHRATETAWGDVIRDGLPDLGMQGFSDQLNDEQIRSLVVYLTELESRANRVPRSAIADGVIHTERLSYRLEEVVKNPKRMWGVSFLPSGQPIVTEIDGAIRLVTPEGTLASPLQQTPEVVRRGQGGMLDIAVHPDYADNGWIYVSFAEGTSEAANTTIARGRIRENRWVDGEILFRVDPKHRTRPGRHYGTRIVFKDGDVYFAIGDRGRQNDAQKPDWPNGKIHRIREDGSVPPDNPFREEGLATIWSTGHRNPQALTLRPETGELWSTEHGPRGGDELNLVQRGKNYGWPRVTFGINYNGTPITEHTQLPGLEPPVMHWTPSIAVCGMAFADGSRYPEWEGDLLVGGLVGQVVERLRIEEGRISEREIILKNHGRVRDIKTAPDGTVYVILEQKSQSRLVRMVPAR